MKPTYRKSLASNLLLWSDLTFGLSFKVKQWFTDFGELSFWCIQFCIGSPMRRSSFLLVLVTVQLLIFGILLKLLYIMLAIFYATFYRFYPTAPKGCRGIVFTHGVRMGGRLEEICPACILETIRCRKLILGRDIG